MPPHLHYVEPYAGGLSVLLAKAPEGVSEVVNDLSGGIVNFWRVIADPAAFAAFRWRVEATPFSEEIWRRSGLAMVQAPDGAPDPSAAAEFFVRCRQSLGGRMEGFALISRNRVRRGMNDQASAWLSAVDGLGAVHERLRSVVILNRDALEVIRTQDGPNTLFYLDPPYLHETRTSPAVYECEMAPFEHVNLLHCLEAVQGRFMLSGYRSDLYDSFATKNGWRREDYDLPNHAAGGDSKRRMTECIWRNFA